MLNRLLAIYLPIVGLGAAYWFTADFRFFMPSCDGPFEERAYFAALTAAGPFAIFIDDRCLSVESLIVAILIVGLVAAGLIWPRSPLARMTSYFGVACWFIISISIAALRVT